MIVVPALEFAKLTAPRKLQSFAAGVQADAAAASSVRSPVIEATIAGITAFIGIPFALAAARCRNSVSDMAACYCAAGCHRLAESGWRASGPLADLNYRCSRILDRSGPQTRCSLQA